MPLLGKAAMLLSFDIVPEAIAEHDESLDTLSSDAYLERLDHPTPWTSRMMPHYRGMTRGLCSVAGSRGFGLGHLGLLMRFKPAPGAQSSLGDWLGKDIHPRVPEGRGIGSAHLLVGAVSAQMTNEQRIRGADAGVDWALLTTGYDQHALEALAKGDLCNARFEEHGATGTASALYRTDYSLSAREIEQRTAP